MMSNWESSPFLELSYYSQVAFVEHLRPPQYVNDNSFHILDKKSYHFVSIFIIFSQDFSLKLYHFFLPFLFYSLFFPQENRLGNNSQVQ